MLPVTLTVDPTTVVVAVNVIVLVVPWSVRSPVTSTSC
jgi:hypothetical protein